MGQDTLYALKNSLVREFRSSQSLLHLTIEERQALVRGDVPRLLALAEHKEALLDRLGSLAEARRQALPPGSPVEIDADDLRTIERLQEGVQVLAVQVRELAQGNRLLAAVALKQAASQQAGLLDDARTDLPALFAELLAAREGPSARDTGPRPEAGLIETMTNLYRQQTAYRAVLKQSSRMLAIP
ncbi:MAG: flagellar export chaperone FlgN [Chloroflexota bacterium]